MERRTNHSPQTRCPSDQELADFTAGKLTLPALDAIAGHIGKCNRCRMALSKLDGDADAVITRLRDSLRNPLVQEEEFERVSTCLESVQVDLQQTAGRLTPTEPGSDPPDATPASRIRCPFCHELTPLPESLTDSSILCGNCGGRFGLALKEAGGHKARPGTRIAHFELQEFLGEGSFGTVWKAQDTILNRPVALKVPRQERLRGKDVDRFLREARAAAQVRHPGIVHIHEVAIENDTIFIASELVEGTSLEAAMARQRFAAREAAQLCLAIAEALHAAHSAGTIHRDLKPANVLLDHDGNPHIADFGLAKHVSIDVAVTVDGRILGTPVYMSPEQASGQGAIADERSDIYALGAILFELLTGHPPFDGDIHVLVSKILLEEPASPSDRNPGVPHDLETICLKCLEKTPGGRYQSAEELATDLRLFLDGKPIHARPATRLGRMIRWIRRKPALAGVSIASVVLFVTTIAALGYGHWKATSALHVAEDNLYFHSITSAQQKWLANDPVVAEAILDECPIGPRDFEWGFLKQLIRTPIRRLRNAGGSIAYRPDGLEIATGGGSEPYLKIWDTHTLEQKHRLVGHGGWMADLEYSSDGTRIVSIGGADGTVRLWEALDGDPIRILGNHKKQALRCAFCPDNSQVVSIGDGMAYFWDANGGEQLMTTSLGRAGCSGVAFSPVASHVAVPTPRAETAEVLVLDYTGKEPVTTIPLFDGRAGSLAYSPDGEWLAIGEAMRGIRIWNLKPLGLVATIAGPVSDECLLAFDAAGEHIAAESLDGAIRIWRIETRQVVRELRGHSQPVYDIAFSPDGNHLAAGTGQNEVCIWDITAEQGCIAYHGGESAVHDIAVSPTGDLLAAGFGDGTVRIWHRASGEIVHMLADTDRIVWSVDFSPDGQRLATAAEDGSVRIYNVSTSQLEQHFTEHTRPLRRAVFSPDGRLVASAGLDRRIHLWKAQSGSVQRTIRMKGPSIRGLSFHPSGQKIAGGGADGTVSVFDIGTGEELWSKRNASGRIWDVVYSADGNSLAISRGDGTVRLRKSKDGSHLCTFGDLADRPVALALSPNNRRLVTATARNAVSVWDTSSGRNVLALSRRSATTGAVTFAPDGQAIVTGDIHGTVQLWPTIHCQLNDRGNH